MTPASLAPVGSKAGHILRLALMALLLAFALALSACSERADEANSRGTSGPAPSPLFYEIAREDGAVRGWMLGTIHALPAGTVWRTSAIEAAIAQADVLVVEVAALHDAKAMARTFSELATTPDLPLLADRVASEHRAQAEQMADKAGLSARQQRRTESWAAGLILARLSADGDPAHGVDRALIADFAARPVRELEGARAQLQIFDGLAEVDQRALLTAVITSGDPASGHAERLRMAWLAGDVTALEAATREGILAHPPLRSALYTQRNQRWMPAIEAALLSSERPLIAVGAAHLVGPEGLAALLEARGWRLTRLS